MTQRELADRLGRSPSFVARLESGERQLNVLEFWELAEKAYRINPVTLFRTLVQSHPAKPSRKKKL